MLEFTFIEDTSGTVLLVVTEQPSETCDGGCCFNKAVQFFRSQRNPNFVPGTSGISIHIRGV